MGLWFFLLLVLTLNYGDILMILAHQLKRMSSLLYQQPWAINREDRPHSLVVTVSAWGARRWVLHAVLNPICNQRYDLVKLNMLKADFKPDSASPSINTDAYTFVLVDRHHLGSLLVGDNFQHDNPSRIPDLEGSIVQADIRVIQGYWWDGLLDS